MYAKSYWDTKTNERPIVKQMRLLSESPGHGVCVGGGRSRKMGKEVLQSPRKISNRLLNLKFEGGSDIIDKEPSGHLKHKLKINVGDNEAEIKNGDEFGHIDCEWMLKVPHERYRNLG